MASPLIAPFDAQAAEIKAPTATVIRLFASPALSQVTATAAAAATGDAQQQQQQQQPQQRQQQQRQQQQEKQKTGPFPKIKTIPSTAGELAASVAPVAASNNNNKPESRGSATTESSKSNQQKPSNQQTQKSSVASATTMKTTSGIRIHHDPSNPMSVSGSAGFSALSEVVVVEQSTAEQSKHHNKTNNGSKVVLDAVSEHPSQEHSQVSIPSDKDENDNGSNSMSSNSNSNSNSNSKHEQDAKHGTTQDIQDIKAIKEKEDQEKDDGEGEREGEERTGTTTTRMQQPQEPEQEADTTYDPRAVRRQFDETMRLQRERQWQEQQALTLSAEDRNKEIASLQDSEFRVRLRLALTDSRQLQHQSTSFRPLRQRQNTSIAAAAESKTEDDSSPEPLAAQSSRTTFAWKKEDMGMLQDVIEMLFNYLQMHTETANHYRWLSYLTYLPSIIMFIFGALGQVLNGAVTASDPDACASTSKVQIAFGIASAICAILAWFYQKWRPQKIQDANEKKADQYDKLLLDVRTECGSRAVAILNPRNVGRSLSIDDTSALNVATTIEHDFPLPFYVNLMKSQLRLLGEKRDTLKVPAKISQKYRTMLYVL